MGCLMRRSEDEMTAKTRPSHRSPFFIWTTSHTQVRTCAMYVLIRLLLAGRHFLCILVVHQGLHLDGTAGRGHLMHTSTERGCAIRGSFHHSASPARFQGRDATHCGDARNEGNRAHGYYRLLMKAWDLSLVSSWSSSWVWVGRWTCRIVTPLWRQRVDGALSTVTIWRGSLRLHAGYSSWVVEFDRSFDRLSWRTVVR
jgi:hypothetical protein